MKNPKRGNDRRKKKTKHNKPSRKRREKRERAGCAAKMEASSQEATMEVLARRGVHNGEPRGTHLYGRSAIREPQILPVTCSVSAQELAV